MINSRYFFDRMYIRIFMKLKYGTMINEHIQSSFTSQTLTFNVYYFEDINKYIEFNDFQRKHLESY